jgi:choline dehydrogenase-like flavoprotein
MNPIIVVGSGASGVHFALAALRKGRRVVMLDVGYTGQDAVRPDDTLNGLKQNLPDPINYFLGSRYESLVLPGSTGEYYAFPPSKDHIFRAPPEFRYEATGFDPLFSFAAGGLAQAWTGGCYPFNASELSAFPFGYDELAPYYERVSSHIGISGADDDLAAVMPFHGGLMEPLELDEHAAVLLDTYRRRRSHLNGTLGCRIGRARVATLPRPLGDRPGCDYPGRCFWGCPSGAFYTPSLTLAECRAFPEFRYFAGLFVDHFRLDGKGAVRSVIASSADGQTQEFPAGSLVLAAGTLCSARIFLESLYRDSGKTPELHGLMDNRQIFMPFVNLRMLGRAWNPNTYQYHQVVMAVRAQDTGENYHGQVTTLKTAMIHPMVQTLPFDLGTSITVFRNVHSALGMVNIQFPDHRREENYVALDVTSTPHRLAICYRPEKAEGERLKRAIATFRKILWKLDCFAPSRKVYVRPIGANVHYAGTVPMADKPGPLSCTKHCRSHDVENLYFADGTTFPALPSKNITFTLMANATRIAEEAF